MNDEHRKNLDKLIEIAREPVIEKLEKAVRENVTLKEINDELLNAVVLVDYAIPPSWGDKCVDGVVNIDLSSDAIEAVQSAIKFAKGKGLMR